MTVSRTKLVGIALVLFAATVWLYWPTVHGEFLRQDDREYLRQAVRLHGLTWNAVKWAFTTTAPYYHPLPRLSHVLDYQIWGKNAVGHHATSVVVHALNAALVFGFLWTLLGAAALTTSERLAMALGVALVFAIHPFQAESVAWMAGRTQLLCTMFEIGCLWAYISGARRWTVWALFAFALLCKPMAVSLPFVMLAIDYFPLRRYEQLGWGRLLREKAVVIGLAAVAAAGAIITESRKGGLMIPLEKIPLSQRVPQMFQSLMFYPWKLVWPGRLFPYYPLRSGISLGQPLALASALCVGVVTLLSVRCRRRAPALAATWGAYVIFILPVSGLAQTETQSVALRYAYVAILPLLLLAGGAAVWAWRRSTTVARVALISLLGCELWVFDLGTRNLMPMWHDDETWWRVTVEKFPDSELANRLLTGDLLGQGRGREALEYAQRDVRIAPQASMAHNNLGVALSQTGKMQEAIGEYEQALRLNPGDVDAHVNLGVVFLREGRAQEAIGHYEQALRLNPDLAAAHKGLGLALERTGKVSEAAWQYQEALRLEPDDVEAYNDLGRALKRMGNVPEAAGQYEQALRINPDYVEALNNLAWLLATRPPAEGGDPVRAMALAERACKLTDNGVAACLDTLAASYAAAGRFDDAVGAAQKAIPLAGSTSQTQLVSKIEMRLGLYRADHAYYETQNVSGSRHP